MEKEFYAHQVPPGLGADNVEFFVMNGGVQFIHNGEIHLFDEITIDIAIRLRKELEEDHEAMNGMELLGIYEPNEQIEKYAFCGYGQLNAIPDLQKDTNNPEYWDCGCRPCMADGLICKYPKVKTGHLTKTDIRVIRQIASDQPNKIIADHLHRSVETINKECKTIAEKIGCHTQKGISNFAGVNNIQ